MTKIDFPIASTSKAIFTAAELTTAYKVVERHLLSEIYTSRNFLETKLAFVEWEVNSFLEERWI